MGMVAMIEGIQGDICLSGGADGADLQWGMVAGSIGHNVIHWSFDGAKTVAPSVEIVRLNQDQLIVADPYLERANRSLRRKWPVATLKTASLLRRNYYQVIWSDAVYAVASFDAWGQVAGGTAWALQMFIDRFDREACAAYLFDQGSDRWMTWTSGGWRDFGDPPMPSGIYGAVGSRKLLQNGKEAIRDLMGYQRLAA